MENSLRRLWPVRPRPATGEGFASWLYRLSYANAARVHSFTNLTFPGRQIWNRDLDSLCDVDMFSVLAEGTGIAEASLRGLTLQALEGTVFETVAQHGFTPFLLPLGLYHRIRRAFGSQYCPLCLDEQRPFARLSWRLAWNTCCQAHGIRLRDRCHQCAHPFIFHRKGFRTCWNCDVDLRAAAPLIAEPEVACLELEMHKALTGDWMLCNRLNAKHPIVAFNVVYDLMSMVSFGARAPALRDAIDRQHHLSDVYQFQPFGGGTGIERLNVQDRHVVMRYVAQASGNWPMRFVEAACQANYWRSWVLRERRLADVPFPLASLLGTLLVPDEASITGKKRKIRCRQ